MRWTANDDTVSSCRIYKRPNHAKKNNQSRSQGPYRESIVLRHFALCIRSIELFLEWSIIFRSNSKFRDPGDTYPPKISEWLPCPREVRAPKRNVEQIYKPIGFFRIYGIYYIYQSDTLSFKFSQNETFSGRPFSNLRC